MALPTLRLIGFIIGIFLITLAIAMVVPMGTLVIFDRTPAGRQMPWEERLRRENHGDVVVRWL